MARIAGTRRNDRLVGTRRDDSLSGFGGNDTLVGGHGNDKLIGDAGNDRLLGSAGDDRLFGGAGVDLLDGGAGDDQLDGGIGRDDLRGGTGDDRYLLDDPREIAASRVDPGIDEVRVSFSYTLGPHQERLVLLGGAALNGTGNGRDNQLIGNAAANRLLGGAGGDRLDAGAGHDHLDGGAGADRLLGGAGNDVLVYDPADLLINGGTGSDTLLANRAGLDINRAQLGALRNFETIDLRGGGAQRLSFDAADLPDLSGGARLTLRADASDVLRVSGQWRLSTDVDVGGVRYHRFLAEHGGELRIDSSSDFTVGGFRPLIDLGTGRGYGITIDRPTASFSSSVDGVGDVNGDGYDDLVVSVWSTGSGTSQPDAVYLVFGSAAGPDIGLALDGLDGATGVQFALPGGSNFGPLTRGAGDVNGDGYADLLLGEFEATLDGGRVSAGQTWLVYGYANPFGARLQLETLPASEAVRVEGDGIGAYLGRGAGTAGDVNGDGLDDFLLAQLNTAPGEQNGTALSMLLFGQRDGLPAITRSDQLDGSNGFRMVPPPDGPYFDADASSAGDFNGDGYGDLLVAALPPYLGLASQPVSFVVFGNADGFMPTFDLGSFNGRNGFALFTDSSLLPDPADLDISSAGDVNGDGLDDLVIGAPTVFAAGERQAGVAFVVYGREGVSPANVDLASLNGSNGFLIRGYMPEARAGIGVAGVGDVNGDGYDDLAISSSPPVFGREERYIVFGGPSFDATLDLATLDGSRGLKLFGDARVTFPVPFDLRGAGDLNGDGFDDVVYEYTGQPVPGVSTVAGVIYGRDFTGAVSDVGGAGDETLTGTLGADALVGGDGDDVLDGLGGGDALSGGGGDDVLVYAADIRRLAGGNGVDTLRLDGAVAALDLTGEVARRIEGIERVDLGASGDQRLTLDPLALLNLSTTSNLLHIDGAAGDAVLAGGGWLDAGRIVEQGVTYQRYLHGEAELRVAEAIDRSGIGVAGLWLDGRGAARELQGGAGDDLYLVDDVLDSVSEAVGAGVDTVRATISFTLPIDVEILRLGGLTNLDGTGGVGSQQLFGNAGNNRLDGGGGSDALRGGVGNDELVFDAADSLIDGESGLDTLRLDASGVVLDLTQSTGPSLDGIERIDLGAGGNTLVLTVVDVLDLPDAAAAWLNAATRQLLVTGEAGDTVQSLEQGWVRGADLMVGGESYASFTIDGIAAQLLVDLALTRQIT